MLDVERKPMRRTTYSFSSKLGSQLKAVDWPPLTIVVQPEESSCDEQEDVRQNGKRRLSARWRLREKFARALALVIWLQRAPMTRKKESRRRASERKRARARSAGKKRAHRRRRARARPSCRHRRCCRSAMQRAPRICSLIALAA